MLVAREIISNQRSRGIDPHGSGQFGVSRDHGARVHKGLDVCADPGESVFCPIDGDVLREALPYPDDPSKKGVVIRGTGPWIGYEVKIFYVRGLRSGPFKAGERVGFAQDLTEKYPGITNHVHVEVRLGNSVVDPSELFRQCF